MNTKSLILVLVVLSIFACKKSTSTKPNSPTEPPDSTNPLASGVYAVGGITNPINNEPIATLWVNGKAIKLSTAASSIAIGVARKKEDIYIVGYNSDNSSSKACYWKNNTLIYLTDRKEYVSGATAITVQNNDVYITGVLSDFINTTPVYWKNGVMSSLQLPDKSTYITTTSIAVQGNDVYVGGYYKITQQEFVGCYWKNGVIKLMAPSSFSVVTGIAVSGTDVYTVGRRKEADDTQYQAGYWKNGTVIPLNISEVNLGVSCIAINGADTYIGGAYGEGQSGTSTKGFYWKNGIVTKDLGVGVNHIVVQGNDIYTAGTIYGIDKNTLDIVYAAYTKNGVTTPLNQTDYSYVRDFVVVP